MLLASSATLGPAAPARADAACPPPPADAVQAASRIVAGRLFAALVDTGAPRELVAQDEATVVHVFVQPGRQVAAGEPLLSLTSPSLEAGRDAALAALAGREAAARSTAGRVDLARQRVARRARSPQLFSLEDTEEMQHELDVAQAERDAAHAALRHARLVLEQAQVRLAALEVKSPEAGRIEALPLSIGSRVAPGTVLLRLRAAREPTVRTAWPRAARPRAGTAACVFLPGSERAVPAQVVAVSDRIDHELDARIVTLAVASDRRGELLAVAQQPAWVSAAMDQP